MTIKEKIRNTLIILCYFTGIPSLRVLFYKFSKKPILRVIVFHEIKENQIEDFQKKLSLLKRKFNLISPQDFLRRNLSEKKMNILLTLDDGFENWFQNVVPILKKEGISAIFFLDKRGLELAPELSKMGFEIGSHTLGHPRLPELSLPEIEKELTESKKLLNQRIGREIIFFAYPFGDRRSFNSEVKKEVKNTGYQYGFTILPGVNTEKTDDYLLHRDGLNVSWSDLLFLAWCRGSYDYLKKVSDTILVSNRNVV